jgi:hypothetical protein
MSMLIECEKVLRVSETRGVWRPVKEAMGRLQGRKRPGRSRCSEVWRLILMSRAAKVVELGDHLQWVYPRCGEKEVGCLCID